MFGLTRRRSGRFIYGAGLCRVALSAQIEISARSKWADTKIGPPGETFMGILINTLVGLILDNGRRQHSGSTNGGRNRLCRRRRQSCGSFATVLMHAFSDLVGWALSLPNIQGNYSLNFQSNIDFPEPLQDPKRRSTLGLYNLHHRSIRIQNWGLHFLDPPGRLGCKKDVGDPSSSCAARQTMTQTWPTRDEPSRAEC